MGEAELREIFELIDADGSGQLGREEVAQLAECLTGPATRGRRNYFWGQRNILYMHSLYKTFLGP